MAKLTLILQHTLVLPSSRKNLTGREHLSFSQLLS